ncbi:MAG: glycosyltransferase family 2 protein, partial [SAR324 cluster bacterium]|nr:glycosyltransferase family 2 protein [SAR324 cluster bacterium]
MRVAIVIPCYKVKDQILDVLMRIGNEVNQIFVVDDCCPQGSGRYVDAECNDPRVTVIFHSKNQGVGGAMVTGYRAALDSGADIIVKMDGDGQMDPHLIKFMIAPILSGRADYVKGNRFFELETLSQMPIL